MAPFPGAWIIDPAGPLPIGMDLAESNLIAQVALDLAAMNAELDRRQEEMNQAMAALPLGEAFNVPPRDPLVFGVQ